VVHTLLQYLPNLPRDAQREAAVRYAASFLPAEAESIADQMLGILRDAALAPLFGPGSRAEQAITGIAAGKIITGRVDRLAVLPDQVIVADYKTARRPPAAAEAVPVLYLRQLAAYRAVLRLVYPDRPVHCVLVWTEGAVAMRIPGELLDSHAPHLLAA